MTSSWSDRPCSKATFRGQVHRCHIWWHRWECHLSWQAPPYFSTGCKFTYFTCCRGLRFVHLCFEEKALGWVVWMEFVGAQQVGKWSRRPQVLFGTKIFRVKRFCWHLLVKCKTSPIGLSYVRCSESLAGNGRTWALDYLALNQHTKTQSSDDADGQHQQDTGELVRILWSHSVLCFICIFHHVPFEMSTTKSPVITAMPYHAILLYLLMCTLLSLASHLLLAL